MHRTIESTMKMIERFIEATQMDAPNTTNTTREAVLRLIEIGYAVDRVVMYPGDWYPRLMMVHCHNADTDHLRDQQEMLMDLDRGLTGILFKATDYATWVRANKDRTHAVCVRMSDWGRLMVTIERRDEALLTKFFDWE